MISVKIDKEIHNFIKKRAKKSGMKIEGLVEKILRPWYEKEKNQEKKGDQV